MSQTEVHTTVVETGLEPRSSVPIRARSPHPSDSPTSAGNDKAQIELAELGRTASRGSKSLADVAGVSATPSTLTVSEQVAKAKRWKAHWQFVTLCWSLFLAGWNDGTIGPLLPRIQEVYHVGFAVVSLIFVFNCIGFISAALANVFLTDKFGFGVVMVIGSVAQIVAYAIDTPAPPFPALVFAYAINGFGIALQDAGANGYVASYKHGATTKMGILHAVYGAGALVAPLVSTQFAQMPRWSFHYLTSLGIALSNTIMLIAVFRFKTQDEAFAEIGQEPDEHSSNNQGSKYRQMFKLRELHLLAFFILIYVGVEVTLGGWTVTYVINERGGGPSAGYISSGFFGGLTFGRLALLWLNKKVGERLVVFIYIVLAIALELVVWLVPSLIGDAIAVSFVGVLLGPVYPIVMNHSARILPPWLLTGCIGWIAGFGQAGSALLPFLTGAIASSKGIWSLQPLIVAMMALNIGLWFLVPNHPRKVE